MWRQARRATSLQFLPARQPASPFRCRRGNFEAGRSRFGVGAIQEVLQGTRKDPLCSSQRGPGISFGDCKGIGSGYHVAWNQAF